MKALFEGMASSMKTVFEDTPLFRERNTDRYPYVKHEEMAAVREHLRPMEALPLCGRGMAKATVIDATENAYMMYDMIFLFLGDIIQSLQMMADDERMLEESHEKRVERYEQMLAHYLMNLGKSSLQHFQEELEAYKRQHADEKNPLETYLKKLESEALFH